KSIEKYPSINHHLLETFRSLRLLVDKYELNRDNNTVANAAEYVLSCQTSEGDIRGILGNQYIPYYCGAILYLLIKAGYGYDIRVEKALQWLKKTKQNDGGWVIPLQTLKKDAYSDDTYKAEAVRADEDNPSSHLATGMVLRCFAIHPEYKRTVTAMNAARLLKKRMLKPDLYNDRKSPEFWLKFQYPYWFNTLVSSLDTLHQLGYKIEDQDICRGIDWLLLNQNDLGLWGKPPINAKHELDELWIAYDICRLLKCYLL
ncbi:MAG: hypothetical protein MI922_13540, partial [Bacteroidales bacterium]|nr:hypothetical protein [Bacteroidales bacterium]